MALTFDGSKKAPRVVLEKYMREEMGINPPKSDDISTLRSKVQRHMKDAKAAPGATEIRPSGQGNERAGEKPKEGYVRIILHNADKPHGGDRPLFVGVQGNGYTIPREVEVDVPESVVEVLRNAVELRLNEETGEHQQLRPHNFEIVRQAAA